MKWIVFSLLVIACVSCRHSYSAAARTELVEKIEALRTEKSDFDPEITDQALVVQTSEHSELFDSNPQIAFQQEPPQFELRIPCDDRRCADEIWIRQLPVSGQQVIRTYWSDAIRFHLANRVLYSGMTDEEKRRLSDIHNQNMDRMLSELSLVEIETPFQVRVLSRFEIGQLTEQLNRCAQAVAQKSLEAKDFHNS